VPTLTEHEAAIGYDDMNETTSGTLCITTTEASPLSDDPRIRDLGQPAHVDFGIHALQR